MKRLATGFSILVFLATILLSCATPSTSTTTITQTTTTTATTTTTVTPKSSPTQTATSTPPPSTVTVTVTAPQPPPTTITVTATQTTTIPMQLYSNVALGITMEYPQNWGMTGNARNTLVEFAAPPDESGTSPAYVSLALQDLSINIQSLNDFTSLTLQQLPQTIGNYQLLSQSGAATLANNPAYVVVYTGNQGQASFEWLETWTVVSVTASGNKRAYTITYWAEPNRYNDFLATAQAIINSFAISS